MKQTIEDNIKNVRVQAMKAKYYDFILAFKEYEKNQSKENAALFISAAEKLAEDDITDIIFTADLFSNEPYIKEFVRKFEDEQIEKNAFENSLNEIDYDYMER